MIRLFLPALVVLLSIAVAGCSRDDEASPTPSPTRAALAASPTAQEAAPTTAVEPTVEVAAPQSSPSPTLAPAQPISWNTCGSFECASYEVPLDYAEPQEGTITLSLMRSLADPEQRIGPLFINPGGPGGSAVNFLPIWLRPVDDAIAQRFDIIAMDPRGVGRSTPLRCNEPIQDLLALDPDPQSEAEWSEVEEINQELADLCTERANGTLPYLGTENVARDMDRIREALGEETISYVGYSYGSTIGQVYADLFPSRLRAFVLDGVVDLSLSADERNLQQTLGFEAALERFISDCRASSCLPGDPREVVHGLIAQTDEAPIPSASADRPLSQGDLIWGILGSLYAPFQRPGFTGALQDAANGDGSAMIRLVDSYWERGAEGYSNLFEGNIAVNCLDYAYSRSLEHHQELSDSFAQLAPTFGALLGQLGVQCAVWPPEPLPLSVPDATGYPPILLIGNLGDPATPYKWAVEASQYLDSAVLLTNHEEGHTAYGQGGGCVEQVVDAYLLDLQVPPEGATCGDESIEPVPPLR